MRKYNVQFLPIKIHMVSPSRVLPIPRSVVGSKPLCTCMWHWLRMKNGTMPLAPRRLPNLGRLEALSMFRLQRQYPIICGFNVVLRLSELRRSTKSNQPRWWDLFGKRQPEGVVERLERTLNLGKTEKRGYEQSPRCIRRLRLELFDTSCRRRLLASAIVGGDGNWAVKRSCLSAEKGGI